MEMPVPCPKCNEWVELNDTRTSNLTGDLLCDDCCSEENEVAELKDEIDTIQRDLDNDEDYMKGDRRGWKNNIKDLKKKIKDLGFNYDQL